MASILEKVASHAETQDFSEVLESRSADRDDEKECDRGEEIDLLDERVAPDGQMQSAPGIQVADQSHQHPDRSQRQGGPHPTGDGAQNDSAPPDAEQEPGEPEHEAG